MQEYRCVWDLSYMFGIYILRKHRLLPFLFCESSVSFEGNLSLTGLHMVWESQTAMTNEDAGDGNSFFSVRYTETFKKNILWTRLMSAVLLFQKQSVSSVFHNVFLFPTAQNVFCICVTTYNKWYTWDALYEWLTQDTNYFNIYFLKGILFFLPKYRL